MATIKINATASHAAVQSRKPAPKGKYVVRRGAGHGALVMTTPGETSMVTAAEVAVLVRGGSPRVRR
jgi:hypothetical protein